MGRSDGGDQVGVAGLKQSTCECWDKGGAGRGQRKSVKRYASRRAGGEVGDTIQRCFWDEKRGEVP